jgi:hypothetical protein
MEKLQSYEFRKPSRSRYAPVVTALVDEGVFAVRLKRGPDFPEGVSMDSVQGAVADQVRKAGRRAKTFRESDDALVVSLATDEPRSRGRSQRRRTELAAA